MDSNVSEVLPAGLASSSSSTKATTSGTVTVRVTEAEHRGGAEDRVERSGERDRAMDDRRQHRAPDPLPERAAAALRARLPSSSDLSFMEVCRGSAIQLLNFADAVAISSHSPKRLFKVLDVYETLGNLMTEFELLFSNQFCSTSIAEINQPKWWEKNDGPNMIDIHSTQEFLSAVSQAGDGLVIVEFYGPWCASCRALFPKEVS